VIRISERQRHYLQQAMAQFIGTDPGFEADELGEDIPTVLEEMLQGPLVTEGINDFVL